jgi:hypothetical protein
MVGILGYLLALSGQSVKLLHYSQSQPSARPPACLPAARLPAPLVREAFGPTRVAGPLPPDRILNTLAIGLREICYDFRHNIIFGERRPMSGTPGGTGM